METPANHHLGTTRAERAMACLRELMRRWRAHRMRCRAAFVLQSMDDRMLRDIGLSRAEADSLAGGRGRRTWQEETHLLRLPRAGEPRR